MVMLAGLPLTMISLNYWPAVIGVVLGIVLSVVDHHRQRQSARSKSHARTDSLV